MAGGILQIIAYGAQDVYLTNNPQITFFKTVYRRHTNFSVEPFEFTILEKPTFGTKNKFVMHRNGDLVTKMYLRVVIEGITPTPGSKFAWIRRLGHAIIQSVEINIGGARIDRQTGTWLDIWYELARSGYHDKGYLGMIGDVPSMTSYDSNPKPEYTLFIPLKFWFNNNYGLALPMIGIQYHQVTVIMEFSKVENMIVTNSAFNQTSDLKFLDVGLLVDFIFLDKEERRKFATLGHEYLIEQVQFTGEESIINEVNRFKLDFNFPTKELFWGIKNGNYVSGKKFLCYTHKDNWTSAIRDCSGDILENSILLLESAECDIDSYGNEIIISPGICPPDEGTWEEFLPGTTKRIPPMSPKITVKNGSIDNTLWLNTTSLTINGYNLTDKISANIEVTIDDVVIINNITTELTIRDVSIPVEVMTDTRINSDDVCVNIFSNYGLLIDGSHNPIQFSLLEFNDQKRFDKRTGNFFNYLQPELHHSNTPKDGINVYSFAVKPENYQPSGTANFSKIENIIFTVWIKDKTMSQELPSLNIINEETFLYIFALSYNIFRINSGLAGLSYSD
jgi:hypothetical protein